MKLGIVKRISQDDLSKSGENLPKWLITLLNILNEFIEKVGLALQGRLTFRDNFQGKVVENITFTHDTEVEVNPFPDARRSAWRVAACYPASTGGVMVEGFKWIQKQNGNIGVTFKFGGVTEAKPKLYIELEA